MLLRERFHKVILSRGYSEVAAQGIMDEWLEKYMEDVPEFDAMLTAYETGTENDRPTSLGSAPVRTPSL